MQVLKPTNQKLFSIIVATYNCGQKIENTLQSIFSQNKDLFELIILDSLSTDKTLDYIKTYENDLTLISQKDHGIYDAFNKGIDLSTGKYIYFIGAGDCLKPGILEQIKESFVSPDSPHIIYGKVYFLKQKKNNGQEYSAELFIRDCLCQQGIFYRRDTFDINGKFELRYKVFADWFFNLKCFLHSRIKTQYINYVIADYEEGGVSSKISNDLVFKKEFPLFVRKQLGFTKYLMCQAFFFEPYLFNCIYYGKYNYIPEHLKSSYALPGYLASAIKPYVLKFRSIKKRLTGF